MPINRKKLETIMADPDFMSLPDNEQESFLDEMSQSEKPNMLGSMFNQGLATALETARNIPGQSFAQNIPGMESPTTKTGIMGAENIAERLTSGVTENPSTKELPMIGKINPRTVSKGIVSGILDPRNLATASAGVARMMRPKNFGKLARGIADISSQDIKSLRNIGADKVFKPNVESVDFVGREVAPKVASMEEKLLGSLSESALRQIGVKPDIMDDVRLVKKEFNLKELPTPEKADDFFEKVISQEVFEGGIQPEKFKAKIKSLIPQLEEGLGKEDALVRQFRTMINNIETPSSLTESVTRGAGNISRNLSKDTYLATRRQLNSLFSGNDNRNMFVQMAKEALDQDAANSGITGIARARAIYRVSRELEKVRTHLENPKRLKNTQTRLEAAQKPGAFQEKQALSELLGDESPSILRDLESNRLAQKMSSKGLYASTGGVLRGMARTGVKAYEESVRPSVKGMFKKILNKP